MDRAALLRHAGLDDEAALLARGAPDAVDTAHVAVRRALVALRFFDGFLEFAVPEVELLGRLIAAGAGLVGEEVARG